MEKSRERITKIEYFMKVADIVAMRSPDPKRQVGSVIINDKDRIIGTGYNGFPPGFDDNSVDWSYRDNLYPLILHSEMNAILNTGERIPEGSKLYCTLSPCSECLKLIATAGIRTVYFAERYKDFDLVCKLAKRFNIKLIEYKGV